MTIDPLDELLGGTAVADDAAESASKEKPNTIIHPFTGVEVDLDSIDSVLAAFELAKAQKADIGQFHKALSDEIAAKIDPAGKKTQRVIGTHITAKVTQGERLPSASGLKVLYKDTPAEIRDQYLNISSVSVKKREVDKLRGSAVSKENELLHKFQHRIEGAYENGSDKDAYVTIEKGSDD